MTAHLASYGYAAAAMDHSEVVAPELGPRPGQSAAGRARRIDAVIASRVPDVRVLLSALTGPHPVAGLDGIGLDPELIAVAGHSFGGWTALAAPEREPRVRAVVALAPGGSSRPVPGRRRGERPGRPRRGRSAVPPRLTFADARRHPVAPVGHGRTR